MQTRNLIVGAALLAACGGNPPTSTPGTGAPTAVAIQAGNNQTGSAGAALAVRPAVLVKNQEGKVLAGISVVFSVESGGGSLAAPTTVSTGNNGVAQAGVWTLGAGSNTLKASVAGLDPVTFVATLASGATTVLLDAVVGASGGVFTVNHPGDPLNGTTLTIPSPGFGKSAQVQIRSGGSARVPSKPGVRIVSPVMTISSTVTGPAKAGVLIKIPAVLASGEWPIAYVFDPVGGSFYSATVAPSGGGTVTVLLPRLDQTGLDVSPSGTLMSGLAHSVMPAGEEIALIIGAVPLSELAKDQNTGYVSATDDWEYDYALTTLTPNRRFAPGLGLSAAWYFDHFKGAKGQLNRKYQKAAGVEWSNPEGLALSALLSNDIGNAIGALANYVTSFNLVASLTGIDIDSLQLLGLKAGIYTTGRPQILYATNVVLDTLQTEGVTLLVIATHNSTMSVTTGTTVAGLNGPKTLTLSGGVFLGSTWAYTSPVQTTYDPPSTYSRYVSFGPTAGVSAARLNGLWGQLFGGTISNGFKQFKLVSNISRTLTDTLFIPGDTVRYWWESACDVGYTPGPGVTAQTPIGGGSLFERKSGGIWVPLGVSPPATLGLVVRGNGLPIDSSTDGRHIGSALICMPPGGASGGIYAGWAEFTVKNRKVTITPNPLDAFWNTPYTLKATSAYPIPAQPTWVWTLGDGRTVTTTTDTLNVTWPDPTNAMSVDYTVRVSLRSAGVPFAGGSSVAKLRPRPYQFAWRFTTATQASVQLPPGGIDLADPYDNILNNYITGFINDLVTTPSNSLLYLTDGGSCAYLVFEQFPPGQFAPILGPPGRFNGMIASTCVQFGYTGTVMLGTLGSGTLVGTATKIGQEPILDAGGSINATMSGVLLSGTFTFKVRYSTGTALYTITFQGTQVVPSP